MPMKVCILKIPHTGCGVTSRAVLNKASTSLSSPQMILTVGDLAASCFAGDDSGFHVNPRMVNFLRSGKERRASISSKDDFWCFRHLVRFQDRWTKLSVLWKR